MLSQGNRIKNFIHELHEFSLIRFSAKLKIFRANIKFVLIRVIRG